jgi:hypothetical protein
LRGYYSALVKCGALEQHAGVPTNKKIQRVLQLKELKKQETRRK